MDMLQVKDGKIVNAQGQPVRLRGTCVGGWMNMENFIDGYPGDEHGLRVAMAEELGPARAEFFFDRLLDYFLAEDDIAFIQACGATAVRLALNYRHFEGDAEPFHYLEAGFQRLDRTIAWCARHGLYAILDLHAVQGWQNPDWHCDNATHQTLFWQHPHFQERFVALWEELAHHYRGNPAVAGYNVMNEPVCGPVWGRLTGRYAPDWEAINRIYRQVVTAIRAVDEQHIIFLEGDFYSTRFEGLDEPFADNLVYSSHNYTAAGFGPGPYPGMIGGQHWDRDAQREILGNHEGTRYTQHHQVPLWVGEFGSVYNGPSGEQGDRLRALDDEIAAIEDLGAHWTTWTYKDVGVMGWVQLDPECDYLQVIRPVLEAKAALGTDVWQGWLPTRPARGMANDLGRLVAQTIAHPDITSLAAQELISLAALAEGTGSLLQPAYASCFRGMSESELDRVLHSFAFLNCRAERELIEVLEKYLGRPA